MSSESSSKDIPLLTFNSLYNILREEKRAKTLQKLPETFYESLAAFFKTKKEEIQKLKAGTDKEKLRKEHHVLNNSKKITSELLALRASKFSGIAIKNTIYSEEIIGKEGLLKEEEAFFEKVEKETKKFKTEVLS